MKKLISMILELSIALTLFTIPVKAGTKEYIVFGSYPQTEVSSSAGLSSAQYDENGDTTIDSKRYRRMKDSSGGYRYFLYEPILWEEIGSGVYLAKDIIECRPYDEQDVKYVWGAQRLLPASSDTCWEECSIRSWLNGEFSETAFTVAEKEKLTTISLLSQKTAQTLSVASLQKKPTGYAAAGGAYVKQGEVYQGFGRWFLRDVVEYITSGSLHTRSGAAYCVGVTGKISGGLTQEPNIVSHNSGIVPCITLSSLEGIQNDFISTEQKVTVYSPWRQIAWINEHEVDTYLKNGWYRTQAEAKAHQPDLVNSNFRKSVAYSQYAPYVVQYASTNSHDAVYPVYLEYDTADPSSEDILRFIKGLIDGTYTGNQRDHVAFSLKFSFDNTVTSSYQEFSKLCKELTEIVAACWPRDEKGMVNTVSSTWGSSRLDFLIQVNGAFDGYTATEYFPKLCQLADDARAYSDRPLGQTQYIRNYYDENVRYSFTEQSGNPSTALIAGQAKCEGYATAMYELCQLLNIPCCLVASDVSQHMWNRIYLEGAWYDIDLVSDNKYYRVNNSGPFREFDPSGFHDADVRADNISFLWKPNDPDRDELYFYPNVSDADWAVIEDMFSNSLPSAPASSMRIDFVDVTEGQYYYQPVIWALKNNITCGTSSTTFSPSNTCTKAQIITFLWRANGEPSPAFSGTFSDISANDYYYKAALWAAEKELIKGNEFNGNIPCTRSAVVTYLWKLAGSPVSSSNMSAFSDISAGTDCAQAVTWAVENDITSGTSRTTFSPASICTRGQIVTFLYRALAK